MDFGSLDLSGITENFQKLVGIRSEEQTEGKSKSLPPHLKNWRFDTQTDTATVTEGPENPAGAFAVFDGQCIHALGLSLMRKEVRLKNKICPSALVVASIKEGSAAGLKGVMPGDVVLTIGVIATTSLKGNEIVELINHTISLGEKVRFFFQPQEATRRPFSLVLGTAVKWTLQPAAASSQSEEMVKHSTESYSRQQIPSAQSEQRALSRPCGADDEDNECAGEYV